jgi:hypothetical protein
LLPRGPSRLALPLVRGMAASAPRAFHSPSHALPLPRRSCSRACTTVAVATIAGDVSSIVAPSPSPRQRLAMSCIASPLQGYRTTSPQLELRRRPCPLEPSSGCRWRPWLGSHGQPQAGPRRTRSAQARQDGHAAATCHRRRPTSPEPAPPQRPLPPSYALCYEEGEEGPACKRETSPGGFLQNL